MKTRRPKFLNTIATVKDSISDLLDLGLIRDSDTITAEKQPDGRYQLRLKQGGQTSGNTPMRPIQKWRHGVGHVPAFAARAKSQLTAIHTALRRGFILDSEHVRVEPLHDGSVRLHVRTEFMDLAFGISSPPAILMETSGAILMEYGGVILME